MRFRTPEIFLGAFLAVAIFAMGMMFASSYNPSPSTKYQGQQTEASTQDKEGSKSASIDRAKSGHGHESEEKKGEFWSAKLTDWLLAVLTGLLVLFTYRLWKSTDKLWESTKATVDLAREEFISTHRPQIVVYSLGFGGDANGSNPIPISFRYVNSGDSPAFITGFGSSVMRLSEPAVPTDLAFTHQEVDPPIEVESGMHGFRLTPDTISPDEIVAAGIMDTDQIICVGVVLYRDGNGARRQAGFCRRFDAECGRWVKVIDDEYEYSY